MKTIQVKTSSDLWKWLLGLDLLWWGVVFFYPEIPSGIILAVGIAFILTIVFSYAFYRYAFSKMIKKRGDRYFGQYVGLGKFNDVELITTGVFKELNSGRLNDEECKMLKGYKGSLYLFFIHSIIMLLQELLGNIIH